MKRSRRVGATVACSLAVALITLGSGVIPQIDVAGAQTRGAQIDRPTWSVAAPSAPTGERLVLPARGDVPPPGYRLTARDVIGIASAEPVVRDAGARESRWYVRAYVAPRGCWQASVYVPARPGAPSREIAQVIVDDRTGHVLEAWTGPQVGWTMARGIPGQFGRAVNAPWIWIGLSLLFVLPFVRRPSRMLHLDLAALLAFSVSYAFFGAGNLDVSVPSAYPLLAYLLARMLWIAFRPQQGGPVQLALSANALTFGVMFLVGFRVLLNVVNGNVIDVGYAGVIGGDRILHADALYGAFPADNLHGDTYGPLAYLAYVPFVLALPWGGGWDALPAAHAAAIVFDLACVALLYLAGRRYGGATLGLLLAYLWVACPFTLLVENSASNDALVSALVLGAFLARDRPAGRGSLAVLAGLTKFAPLALVPLFVTSGERRLRSLAGAVATGVIVMAPVALGPGLERFWDRTLGFQSGRTSPFSVWGLYGGLEGLQVAVTVTAAALAVIVAFVPRQRDWITVAALGAAVLIALQLAVEHWFYLYLVWFLPLMLLALLARPGVRARDAAPVRSPARSVPVHM